jgi:hypothetical protein
MWLSNIGLLPEGNIPKLVYEFAKNGNLHDKLHGNNKSHTSLDVCLQISLELKHLHAFIHS